MRNVFATIDLVFDRLPTSRGVAKTSLMGRFYTFARTRSDWVPRQSEFRSSGAEAFQRALMESRVASIRLEGNDNVPHLREYFNLVFSASTPASSEIINAKIQNDQPVTLSLYELVFCMIQEMSSERYNRGENKEKILEAVKYVLFTTLITQNIIRDRDLFALMDELTEYTYEYTNVETSTPFVKNVDNAVFLSSVPFQGLQDTPVAVRPGYSFYEERYENNIKEGDIREELLPNLYARRFYQQAGMIQPQNALENEQRFRIRKEYEDQLLLTDNFVNVIDAKGGAYALQLYTTLDAGLPEEFYSLYAGLLDPDYPTYEYTTDQILTKNKNFMIGCNEMVDSGLSVGASALSLNVSFERDTRSRTDVTDFIQTQTRDASLAIFQNVKDIQQTPDPAVRENFIYSTEYVTDNNQFETPLVNVQFNVYGLEGQQALILNRVPQEYSSTILQTKDQMPDRGDIQQVQTFIHNNKRRRCPDNYAIMQTGAKTSSEVLGYRLRRAPYIGEGDVSEVYIGNTGRERVVYTDTQVVYGREYIYDLSEFRIVYGAKYNTWTIAPDMPAEIVLGYLGLADHGAVMRTLSRLGASFSLKSRTKIQRTVKLVEIPVYDDFFLSQDVFPAMQEDVLEFLAVSALGAGGIAYPRTKVINLPPTPPVIDFYPRAFIDNQVDIGITPVSGKTGTINTDDGTFDESLEVITIGDNNEAITEQMDYQLVRYGTNLEPGFLKYRFKSQSEIRNIVLYRTTNINLNVENEKDLYTSFNPEANDTVVVRKYTTKRGASQDLDNMFRILSYDIRDSIKPNINYFYTCVAEDVHGNISNPSTIYRIRLLSENGMVIPEISTVIPQGTNRKTSDKNLARYVQIDASNIQTFPFVANTENGLVNSRSLGTALNKSIEDQSYIVRFTSKDTGRKFDLKLNFVVRIDGNPITGNT